MESVAQQPVAAPGTGSGQMEQPKKKNAMAVIQEWPLSRKIATLAVLIITILLFGILIFQARVADQQLLYANLSTNDASAVSNWLKTQKIVYSLKNGGRDIWVPANQIYQTRLDLAANGLPSGGGVGFEIFDKQSFALTNFVQKVNHTRALQGELARTIASLAPVEAARVHLALPEKRLFKNQQKKATASVIVTLVPGRTLDKKQVQGIIHLVAGSVMELEMDDVKIIDSNGVVLESMEKQDKDKFMSLDMLSFQQQIETRLQIRAQDLLDKTMGKDHAMVRVTATLDFSKVEKTEEFFDGDDPVIRSEQLNQESSSTASTGGIPGVESNLDGNSQGRNGASPGANSNSRITNYEISKTISKIINPVGSIVNLSVSVLVADRVEIDKDGKAGPAVPRTAEELKSIENMVATAIGIVPERGDVINILSLPFVDTDKVVTEKVLDAPLLIYEYIPLIKYGLIVLGVFFIYLLLIKPMVRTMKGNSQKQFKTVKQLEQEQQQGYDEVEDELPPPPVDEAINMLKKEVRQNQMPAAFIVKNWIQEG